MSLFDDGPASKWNRTQYARVYRWGFNARKEWVSRDEIYRRDRGVCYLCGRRPLAANVQFDHVVPLSRGGAHTVDNIRVTCNGCNARKGDRTVEEMSA